MSRSASLATLFLAILCILPCASAEVSSVLYSSEGAVDSEVTGAYEMTVISSTSIRLDITAVGTGRRPYPALGDLLYDTWVSYFETAFVMEGMLHPDTGQQIDPNHASFRTYNWTGINGQSTPFFNYYSYSLTPPPSPNPSGVRKTWTRVLSSGYPGQFVDIVESSYIRDGSFLTSFNDYQQIVDRYYFGDPPRPPTPRLGPSPWIPPPSAVNDPSHIDRPRSDTIDSNWVSDPVSVITGEFHVDTVDLTLATPGIPLAVRRNYSSRHIGTNEFGFGWLSGTPSYMIESPDGSQIQTADARGNIYNFSAQPDGTTWLPQTSLNPEAASDTGGRDNMFNHRVTSTNGQNYRWHLPDGGYRDYVRRQFPLAIREDTYERESLYIEKESDALGNQIIYEYGTATGALGYGKITKARSSSGPYIEYEYNISGFIASATADDGRSVTYAYDGQLLSTVTLPDGKTIAYAWDAAPRETLSGKTFGWYIIKESKPDGRVIENTYDSERRVITQKATVGLSATPITNATFDYSTPGQTTVSNAYGHSTVYTHSDGLLTSILDPAGNTITKTWYSAGDTSPGAYPRNLASETDARGLITSYKYDSRGNVTEVTRTGDLDGDSATTETTTNSASYNLLNLPESITDERGITTEISYTDPSYPSLPTQTATRKGGNTLRIDLLDYTERTGVSPGGAAIFANGLLESMTVAAGTADEAVTDYDYDATGFRISETRRTGTADPDISLAYVPTPRHEIASITDAAGRVSEFTYDALSRPLTRTVKDETGAVLAVTESTYNANGEVSRTDGPRTGPEDWIEYDYDRAGRPSATRVYRTQAKADGDGVEAPLGTALTAITTYRHDFFGNLTLVIDPRGHTTTHQYDELGRLLHTRRFDATHTAALLAQNTADLDAVHFYDGSLPSGVTPLSIETFGYEPGGEIETYTTVLGGQTTKLYNSRGQPRHRTQADGSVTEWRYYSDGRVFQEILRNGAYWETNYDDIARTVTRTLKTPAAVTLASETRTYDRRGNLVSLTDAEGGVFTTTYDDLDRVKTATGPADNASTARQTTTHAYDAVGITHIVTNGLGETTTTLRDALGRVTQVEIRAPSDTLVRLTAYAYSPDHQSVTITEGTGPNSIARTSYTDEAGRPLLTRHADGTFTAQAYDLGGYPAASTDALGLTTTTSYNALGHLATQTLPDAHTTTFVHDAAGNLLERRMPSPQGTLVAESTYDTSGRITASRLLNGSTTSREFSYAYYPPGSAWAGLLQTTTGPRTTFTTTYDDYLRTLALTTEGAASETDSTTTYGYDKRGLVTSITQASPTAGPATVIQRAYDGYGQLIAETLAVDGSAHSAITQTWNAAGRRASLDEAGSALADPLFGYTYRADGNLAELTATAGAFAFSYGDNGLLINRSNPFRTLTINERDNRGRIKRQTTAVAATDAMVETMNYRPDGTLHDYAVTRGGTGAWNESRAYNYNDRGQLTHEGFSPAPSTSSSLSYTFDENTAGLGIRTAASIGLGAPLSWEVSATTINALARVTEDEDATTARFVQTSGIARGAERVSLSINGQEVGRAQHPGWTDPVGAWSFGLFLTPGEHTLAAEAVHPSGQFTTTANSTFTVGGGSVSVQVASSYDADGNVITRMGSDGTVQTLTWDAWGRLIQVTRRDSADDGYDWNAVYDGLGRRLKTTRRSVASGVPVGIATTIASIYDPLVEFLEIGVVVDGVKVWKVYGPDLNGLYGGLNGTGGLEATILEADGTAKGVVNDSFGNGVASVTAGEITWFTTRVGGYGPLPGTTADVLTDAARVAEATAWRGRRIDPTGFYWLGARFYEPTTGRFLSPDPYGHGSDMSLYAFAGGDPVNYFDPDGRCKTPNNRGYWSQVGSNIWGLLKGVPRGAQELDEFVISAVWHPIDTANGMSNTSVGLIDSFNSWWAKELLDYDYRIPASSAAVGEGVKSYVVNFSFEDGGAAMFQIAAGKVLPTVVREVAPKVLPKVVAPKAPPVPGSPTFIGPVRPALAGVLDGHAPGQGFTGVYDLSTGKVLITPSTAEAVIPEGWVARTGGHADVSAALGGDATNHSGFAVVLQEDGSLAFRWRSGTLNPPPSNLVPEALRPTIVDTVTNATGRSAAP